jgi:hypothetical protein
MHVQFERPGAGGRYDPRPTTTVIHERDKIIEAQRERLHNTKLWAERLRGPCTACRWSSYSRCTNPAVARERVDPVRGTVEFDGPVCEWERAKEYPTTGTYSPAFGYGDRRWQGLTLCGPEGLMFEPRTEAQKWRRGLLGGLWLVPILLALALVAHSLALVAHYGH